jgi:hypothetical protein
MAPRIRPRTVCALTMSAALVTTAGRQALDAQKPERHHEIRIPGTDISLRPGWQLLVHDRCRFTVPESWQPNADATLAMAPDGSTISVRALSVTSWSAHRHEVRASFGRAWAVHEDSDRRLWLEIGDTSRMQHYIDVPNGLSVCSVLLDLRAGATTDPEDVARRIAESVGPAPENWPPRSIK